MNTATEHYIPEILMSRPLQVVIVGAGIGGKTTSKDLDLPLPSSPPLDYSEADIVAFSGVSAAVATAIAGITPKPAITVLEASRELGEIGAGIQVSPNLTRILTEFGLEAKLAQHGTLPLFVRQIRWENGAELTRFGLNEHDRFENAFGSKYYYIHRADLLDMLVGRARELGVTILTNHDVVRYEHAVDDANSLPPEKVVCKNGLEFHADVVVAADGAKSRLCEFVLGQRVPAIPTGDSVYRALLPSDQLDEDILESLQLDKGSVIWLGPQSHVVGYFVRGGSFYNIVAVEPDDQTDEETWKLPGDPERLRTYFERWDPRLRRMLAKVDVSYIWNLRDRPMLDRWLHPEGNMVLLGDSAHPMLPYVGQGAASAVEDAAALSESLKYAVEHGVALRTVLDVYQEVRRPHTHAMREAARKNRGYFQMADGKPYIRVLCSTFLDVSLFAHTSQVPNRRLVMQHWLLNQLLGRRPTN